MRDEVAAPQGDLLGELTAFGLLPLALLLALWAVIRAPGGRGR